MADQRCAAVRDIAFRLNAHSRLLQHGHVIPVVTLIHHDSLLRLVELDGGLGEIGISDLPARQLDCLTLPCRGLAPAKETPARATH